MKVVAIIQARMTSSRLPGKVLMPILGRPVLSYQIERVRRAASVHDIAIATSTNQQDDPLAELARTEGVSCWRGSESDVLSRVADAAIDRQADIVVRLTGDCPLTDPEIVDGVIGRLIVGRPAVDYVTNGIPRSWPVGLDVEAMTRQSLVKAAREAADSYDREHVTPFIYRHPERFRLANFPAPRDLSDRRWTLDESRDLDLIRSVFEALYPTNPQFGYQDVIDLLDTRPDIAGLNTAVIQKARRFEEAAVRGIDANRQEG